MAHTFDTKAQNNTGSTSNPVTLSYTAGATATVLVLGIMYPGGAARTGGAPTYNSIALTQAGTTEITGGSVGATEIWYLLGPSTGSAFTISVPNASGIALVLVASTFIAATGNSSVFDATAQAINTGSGSTNPSVNVTTTANGDVIVSATIDANTLTAGQTSLFTGGSSPVNYGGEYALQATAGTISMNWTAASGRWATSAVAIKEQAKSSNPNSLMLMGVGI